MASKYWIKLYHEILDDPKMGKLDDRLYRRTIECFLLAGEYDEGGFLPSLSDMAWRLRADEEQLETELVELQRVGILSIDDGQWLVTKFADRQSADTSTERWRKWQQRQNNLKYYGSETPYQRESNESLADKIRRDKEVEAEEIPDFDGLTTKQALAIPEIQRYRKITGRIPGLSEIKDIWLKLYGLDITDKKLKTAWNAWVSRTTKNGQPYRKDNPDWIDWAVSEIPPISKDLTSAEKARQQLKREGIYD